MKEKQEMTLDIKEEEREVLREHIVWLTQELERTRNLLKERNDILRMMLNPDSLGWGVNNEIRSLIYNLFSAEIEKERASWNTK
jgi:superfamily I DNA and RNA helicase